MFQPNDRRVLLIGWDAADWRVINPLLEQGKMPALARMMSDGVWGNLATIKPPYSPMLWTSIATGKRPYKHGIHGFIEPTPDGTGVRPVTNLSRSVKAIWNMLAHAGKRSSVVGWWPSHPAEPIDGVMVSNFYQRAVAPLGKPWPMADGTVHPAELADKLAEFRFHPSELGVEHMLPFIPSLGAIDKGDKRPGMCAKILAEATSIHGAATALMQLEPWDFMAVYHDAIDHFCHGFMKYHPPKQDHITDEDFEHYRHVVEAGYRYHDMMLGAMLKLAGDDATVVLISDHGFHPDHLRPRIIPAEPAGPAAEHRHYGIFVAKGPGIAADQRVYGATVLDITPTILHLFDLPVGDDMDGKPLTTLLEPPSEPKRIDSWEGVEGACGMHPPTARESAADNAEAMKQLIELGYVEDTGEGDAEAVDRCIREQRYNLAQAFVDGNQFADAVAILAPLWDANPAEHRFGMLLIECYSAMGDLPKRRAAVETYAERTRTHGTEAAQALRELKPELDAYAEGGPKHGEETPKKLSYEARRLHQLAAPKRAVVAWLTATQAMMEGDIDQAVASFQRLSEGSGEAPGFRTQLGFALAKLERHAEAADEFRRALAFDPDFAPAHFGLATAELAQGNAERAVEHALTSTELIYHQPRAHATLGRALLEWGRIDEAEAALHVALAQAPRLAEAHATLATIYRDHRTDEARADMHERAAADTRVDAEFRAGQQRVAAADTPEPTTPDPAPASASAVPTLPTITGGGNGQQWGDDSSGIITIVAGLPRSGTSMMMQMLAAGGIEPFTDHARTPDSDNPKGYLEHARATTLARDSSWLPEARGKAVKVVAQLLPHVPTTERIRVVFMARDLREVVASQRVMLDRLGKPGAALDEQRLMHTLAQQVEHVGRWLAGNQNAQVLTVRYADATTDPAACAANLAEFLGSSFDASAATAAVDPSLRRQRV